MRRQGYDSVSEAVLISLKHTRAQDLEEARAKLAPQLDQAIINQNRSNALQTARLEQYVLESLPSYMERSPNADPSTIVRNLSQSTAQSVEKTAMLEGKPQKTVALTMPQF